MRVLTNVPIVCSFALAIAACGGATEEQSESAPDKPLSALSSNATIPDRVTNFADFVGDPAAGERVFMKCRTCHVVQPGINRMGPSLAGVIGSKAGTVEGFNYSDANAQAAFVWSPDKMFQYLENPRAVVPGTRMAFAGLKDAQDRADLIAYLQASSISERAE